MNDLACAMFFFGSLKETKKKISILLLGEQVKQFYSFIQKSYLQMDKDSFARKKDITKEDGTVMTIEIETTIGQEIDRNRPIPNNNYFNYTDGIVYVYDGTDNNSKMNTIKQHKKVLEQFGDKMAIFVDYNNKGQADPNVRLTEGITLDNHHISQDDGQTLNTCLDEFACKILDNKQLNDS